MGVILFHSSSRPVLLSDKNHQMSKTSQSSWELTVGTAGTPKQHLYGVTVPDRQHALWAALPLSELQREQPGRIEQLLSVHEVHQD